VQPDDEGLPDAEVAEDGGSLASHAGQILGGRHATIAFVDGVRRGDASLYQFEEATGKLVRGMAGSHAAGAVITDGVDCPFFSHERVQRLVIWGSGATGQLPTVRGGWDWLVRSVADEAPDAPLNGIQERMRKDEATLAEQLFAEGHLVIVDGPLKYVRDLDHPVVGYIKTHHRALLPPAEHVKITKLQPGERTSLFKLGHDRYSSYLRLASGSQLAGPWSGMVRLELPQAAGLAQAIEIADRMSGILPRYAGVPYADPRAPQNLQPIGALEKRLRHLMGDPGHAFRAVRQAVMQLKKSEEVPA
jgi:hypothetical protein